MLMNLDQLQLNEKGIIKEINCNDKITRRLNDLGLLKDTAIYHIFSSPFGNPKAYEFRR